MNTEKIETESNRQTRSQDLTFQEGLPFRKRNFILIKMNRIPSEWK